jgi:hypothetical protein
MQHSLNNTAPSFADIVPRIERVDIRGTVIEMRGIPAPRCFELLAEFPALITLFSEKKDMAKLMIDIPGAAAAIACDGMRRPKDKKLREDFNNLALGDQIKLVTAAIKATMPDGIDPFVEMLATLGVSLPASTPSGKA